MMKCLSLSQPWCWSMLDEVAAKHIENRTWAPPIADIGHVFALHAAKSWDDKQAYRVAVDAQRFENRTPIGYFLHHGITHAPARRELYVTSAIVGYATLDRVVTEVKTLPEAQRRWFFGPYGWVLANVTPLYVPIPAAGKQGFWRLSDEQELAVRGQMGRAA